MQWNYRNKRYTMTNSASTPSHPKTWVVNLVIKRVILVLLVIIVIKYALYDLSYMMSGMVGTVTAGYPSPKGTFKLFLSFRNIEK